MGSKSLGRGSGGLGTRVTILEKKVECLFLGARLALGGEDQQALGSDSKRAGSHHGFFGG